MLQISCRGQITIPKNIRKKYKAKNFQIFATEEGIVLKPVFLVPESDDLDSLLATVAEESEEIKEEVLTEIKKTKKEKTYSIADMQKAFDL